MTEISIAVAVIAFFICLTIMVVSRLKSESIMVPHASDAI